MFFDFLSFNPNLFVYQKNTKMVSKSNRIKKYNYNSSSSSSDTDADDPDYPALRGISKKSSMENIFHSLNGDVMNKMWEERKIKKSRRIRQQLDEESTIDEVFSCRKKGILKTRNGERRMKKATIFSWLIDSKTVQEGEIVFLSNDHNNNTLLKKGILKREGILCFCCNKIFSASGFTFHGGKRRNNSRPYQRIFTIKKRISLLSYMIRAWNKPNESELRMFNTIELTGNNVSDPYDDACMICADGGNLICCDECNSTYHQACMAMEEIPLDSWYCPYCICKFCGDPVLEQNDYLLLQCPQCEKKYHWECHGKTELTGIDMNGIPCAPFCGQSCKQVREKLEKTIVGKQNKLDEGFSWTLLHRIDDDHDHDTYQRTVCHSKLAVALRLMEDCFEPIVDRYTRINLIPSIVYNTDASFNRIQFKGFYTAVLEKNEEIISAASLRIHGTKIAEMPFIATSHNHRSKGMCKKLMVGIESALCYLDVQYLVIPSVPERIGNWIEKYGFELMDSRMEEEIMFHNTVMFHDSIRLQKSLLPCSLLVSDIKCNKKCRNNNSQNCLKIEKANIEQNSKRNKKFLIDNHDRIVA